MLDEVVQSTIAKQRRGIGRLLGVGILFCGVLFVGLWFWFHSSQPESRVIPQQAISLPPPEMPLPDAKAKIPARPTPPNRPQSQPVVVIPKCAEGHTPERLATGERIEPDQETSGDSSLEVTNGPISDAVIRLVDTSTNQTVSFVYIRARDVYTIQGIETGTYSLRYASGLDWFPTCGEFVRNGSIDELPKTLDFDEGYKTTAKVTLFGVPLGNARTKSIDKKRFLEGDQHFSLTKDNSSQ